MDTLHETHGTPDAKLIEEYLAGDPAAFTTLYRRYFRRLSDSCARILKTRAAAEDAAQDALIRALDHLEDFDRRRPLWPWLRAIAMRLALNEANRRSKVTLEPSLAEHAPVDPDHAESVINRRALSWALSRLAPRQRQALLATYVQGRARREAATAMGLKEAAFDQLLLRGRRRLAQALGA